MFRKVNLVIIVLLALGLVGCRACYSPYEMCQPTFNPQRGDRCMGELYRAGSVLGGQERASNDNECKSCTGGDSLLEFNDRSVTSTGAEKMTSSMAPPSTQGDNQLPKSNEGWTVQGMYPTNDNEMMKDFSIENTNSEFIVGKPANEDLPSEVLQKRTQRE